MTTRGLKEKEFIKIAKIIVCALKNYENENVLDLCKKEVKSITRRF